MTEVVQQTLYVVAKELNATLAEARQALETFAERPDQADALNICAERLREVHGVLRVVEVYGAALLAEEMQQVAAYLAASVDDRKNQAEGLDALMRAMVQLPAYLERVLGGGRDLALVLLPLLNDLRAVRGSPLLSEGTLLLLNLTSDRKPQPVAPRPGEPSLTLAQWARRLRPRYQVGLLGWIRGDRVKHNLDILAAVAERIEQITTSQPVFQLWWVVGAVLESLREGGLEGTATLKRLLGHADRELRRLYQEGEAHGGQGPPLDLLNNLLYYVARSTTAGPRIAAVRASFKLQELLPVSEQVEQERENLSAPSVKLMHTVAAAIKEDLARVKDVLDIFVRKGGTQLEELAAQLEMLRKISDTLGVLGLGGLRERVQGEIQRLNTIVASRQLPAAGVLVDIAATLISVEDNLDSQLVRLIMPGPSDATPGEEPDAEFRNVTEAVLRECIVNLARIKEIIAAVVAGAAEANGADQVPSLLRGVNAGLLMLGKSRAVAIVENVGRHVDEFLQPAQRPPQDRLDRLADAIVSVEYYMETLQSGRTDPWYMLDNAEVCLRALAEPWAPVPPAVAGLAGEATYAATMRIEPGAAALQARTEVLTRISQPAQAPAPQAAARADPDLIALFTEEAGEEIALIDTHFAAWHENPLDQEALTRVRRSFHTLKGSGRMVGARGMGEFAWGIETLLNRVISGTLSRTPAMMALLREAVAALPELLEELKSGMPPRADVAGIAARAHAFAEGREAGEVPLRAAAAAAPPLAAPASMPAPALGGAETSMIATAVLMSLHPESLAKADRVAELARAPPQAPPAVDAPMLSTGVLLGGEPGLPRPAPTAAPRPSMPAPRSVTAGPPPTDAAGRPLLEPPTRFVRVSDEEKEKEKKQAARSAAAAPPPPPPSGSEFTQQTPGASGAAASDDPVLLDIYQKEVETHLGQIRAFLKDCERKHAPFAVTEGLHRACHTLAGASKMAAARQGIKVAEPLNLYVRKLHDHGLGLPEAGRRVLADAVAAMAEVAHHIDETTSYFTGQADLVARLKWLDADVEREIQSKGLTPKEEDSGQVPGTPGGADLEFLSSSLMMSDIAPQAAPAPQAAAPAAARAPTGKPATAATGEYDPEIAAIFSEEATELLESADAALQGYTLENHDRERLTALARVLHTLKGGARMAGLLAMGDLAHEFESLLLKVSAATGPTPPEILAVLQRSLDELHRMRDLVGATKNVTCDETLLAQVRALTRGEPPPPILTSLSPQPQPMPQAAAPPAPPAPAGAPPVVSEVAAAPASRPASRAPESASGAPESAPQSWSQTSLTHSAMSQSAMEESRSFALPPGREARPEERQELARVDADLLDTLLNGAGEVSIFRARLEQQLSLIEFNLTELGRVVLRLKEQLRNLEGETEAQIVHKHHETGRQDEFDPLEMDRYSSLHQYSRALAESVSDVHSVQGLLENLGREAQNLLMQQARVVTELQNGLMRTRMVPFQRHVQRLTRIVRQAAQETHKRAELVVIGASGELDRQVLERMLGPFEHLLRNAVVHGLETPGERLALKKSETGRVEVTVRREGSEVVIVVADDGAGMNLRAIRDKARVLGLIDPKRTLSDEEAMQLVLEPGFSTASAVTQAAGRGVGMDVVATEIKKLGGALHMETKAGSGTRFTIRLPFTLAISQALIVRVADEMYALPLPTVEGVVRLPRSQVAAHLAEETSTFEYGGQHYRFQHLGSFIGAPPSELPEQEVPVPVVLVRAGESSTALVTDELVGSREIVVKSVGPQIGALRGISGATILGDGRIVVILDMGTLVRADWRGRGPAESVAARGDRRTFALVVDDSITVRRVTQRLLERNGMRVLTAKDGVDAVAIMQEHVPDVILLDIEMPRMDGYEVAAHVRADPRLATVPIVMITSRMGEKHRARAIELGVDDYLGKPYQESQLLDAIEPLVRRRREEAS
jgi:chemosensory pili system protein ChpA (sensor histidine kinase/response regulator)